MLTMGLIEDLYTLNRSKLQEPLIHAKGAGAKGIFVPYMTMKDYTKACFLQDSEIETPAFVRFSRMMGRAGAADTARDVRGFSVKFTSEDGIYDMVGSSLPVSFIRDPQKYPSLLKALGPCPKTNIHDPERLWRFVANNPESLHMITWLYSNMGTVKSYRSMEGHSVHTYIWENAKGDSFWVRYSWKPSEEFTGIDCQEAEFLAGYDPDIATRDLYESLERGERISYELSVQLIPVKQNMEDELTLLDPTVIWPESSVPPVKTGRLILQSGIDDYYEEVEKSSFSPGRLIPGIDLSPEPLLLAMTFMAMDREGCEFRNPGSSFANSFSDQEVFVTGQSEAYSDNRDLITGQLAWRLRSMTSEGKLALIENIGREILFIDEDLQLKIIDFFKCANEFMGKSLEGWLGIV